MICALATAERALKSALAAHERGRVEPLGDFPWRLRCSCGAEETFVAKIKLRAALPRHELDGVAHRRLHEWHVRHAREAEPA